jgi:hypothetical protein
MPLSDLLGNLERYRGAHVTVMLDFSVEREKRALRD